MKKSIPVYLSLFILSLYTIVFTGSSGCANMVPPGGGPRDSLPPVLLEANPRDSATGFTGNRVVLNFDEYVDIDNPTENVLISPTPTNAPIIERKLRTVSVKLRDTLEPSTTYSINFGNAIKDINEGNVFKNFTYVFSTGDNIDENTFSGRVIIAETGKTDSTLLAILHRNLDDSAVSKEKPRYIARLDSSGNFHFRNLPKGTFAVYVIPNEYSKRYDDTTKLFAFADKPVAITEQTDPVTLYAFSLPKEVPPVAAAPNATAGKDKTLRYNTSLEANKQDILHPLQINFIRKVSFDSTKISLTDKDFKPVGNYKVVEDTNRVRFFLRYTWPPNTEFNLILAKEAFTDSAGMTVAKNDTIRFTTKTVEEYGSVRIRFRNLDLSRNPVLQLVQAENVVEAIPLTTTDFSRKIFAPGEYTMRLLFDTNKNGVWDTGRFYGERRQPEIVISLNTPLSVRANWDFDKEIILR
jgi:hypothetical protein